MSAWVDPAGHECRALSQETLIQDYHLSIADYHSKMKCWYLIHSKPQQETLARENLERQGYESYLPLILMRRRRRGRAFTEVGPMFPRYLFIRLGAGIDDWGPIRSTLGVSTLVKFGQIPARVPENLIQIMKAKEHPNGIQALPPNALKKGQKLRIAEGPFEGYEGLFEDRSGRNRVIILLRILEKQVRLEIEENRIDATS